MGRWWLGVTSTPFLQQSTIPLTEVAFSPYHFVTVYGLRLVLTEPTHLHLIPDADSFPEVLYCTDDSEKNKGHRKNNKESK